LPEGIDSAADLPKIQALLDRGYSAEVRKISAETAGSQVEKVSESKRDYR
jgi:hypothetical protein